MRAETLQVIFCMVVLMLGMGAISVLFLGAFFFIITRPEKSVQAIAAAKGWTQESGLTTKYKGGFDDSSGEEWQLIGGNGYYEWRANTPAGGHKIHISSRGFMNLIIVPSGCTAFPIGSPQLQQMYVLAANNHQVLARLITAHGEQLLLNWPIWASYRSLTIWVDERGIKIRTRIKAEGVEKIVELGTMLRHELHRLISEQSPAVLQ